MQTIKNSFITISVDPHGAELCSLHCNNCDWEYIWQADPKYWKRHSPVLFPIVGRLWNDELRYKGKTYQMSQHGFARDMDFSLIKHTDDELRFRLVDTPETLKKYPFHFELEIGYRLVGNEVHVMWQVHNPSDEMMYFQIGGHPAFNYQKDPTLDVPVHFKLNPSSKSLDRTVIGEKGCIRPEHLPFSISNDGRVDIDSKLFNDDALIFENNQVQEVLLTDAMNKPFLQLSFDAPVIGLWAPAKNTLPPFICVEPWYGRCDRMHYEGDYQDKDWMQHLGGNETFNAEYIISTIV